MQSLFSEHWHIVRHLRPQLRQNIEILPRILRGKNHGFYFTNLCHSVLSVLALKPGILLRYSMEGTLLSRYG